MQLSLPENIERNLSPTDADLLHTRPGLLESEAAPCRDQWQPEGWTTNGGKTFRSGVWCPRFSVIKEN